MTDSSTDVPQTQPAESDQATADNPLQQFGYVRVYRAIRKDVGTDAAYLYGVLEDYAQMSARRNIPNMPPQALLAERMGEPLRNVQRWTADLRRAGWLETEKLRGGRIRYILKSAPTPSLDSSPAKNGGIPSPAKNGGNHPPKMAGTESKPELASQNERDTRASASARKADPPISHDISQNSENGKGQDRSAASKEPALVDRNSGQSTEEQNAYWHDATHGAARRAVFDFVAGAYPNGGADRVSAMAAWRRTVNTRLDGREGTDPLVRAITYGVQWYAAEVKREKTEARYVTRFHNWVHGEKWNDAPADVRELAKGAA